MADTTETRKTLNTASRVLKYLGSIVNELKNDNISVSKAKAIGYLCSIMIKGFETADIEKRIEELEDKLNNE